MYFVSTQKIQDISDVNCYPIARILVCVFLTVKNILCTSASTEVTRQSHCIFFLTASHEMSGHRNFSVLWTVTLVGQADVGYWYVAAHIYIYMA